MNKHIAGIILLLLAMAFGVPAIQFVSIYWAGVLAIISTLVFMGTIIYIMWLVEGGHKDD